MSHLSLIESATAVGLQTGALNNYLKNLIDLQIIEKIAPVGCSTNKSIYKIKDSMYTFWYRFVEPNQGAIEDKISLVIKGQLVLNQNGQYALKSKEYPEGINVSNLSTGLKSFLIIKKLIVDNLILTRDILILDEPEIHLHPECQVVYAELLVLLQQYFDLTILLTTHSPFFLRAIEVFSKKYGITDKCKYYLANANVDTAVTFDEVTDTSVIYDKMANAFFLDSYPIKARFILVFNPFSDIREDTGIDKIYSEMNRLAKKESPYKERLQTLNSYIQGLQLCDECIFLYPQEFIDRIDEFIC